MHENSSIRQTFLFLFTKKKHSKTKEYSILEFFTVETRGTTGDSKFSSTTAEYCEPSLVKSVEIYRAPNSSILFPILI